MALLTPESPVLVHLQLHQPPIRSSAVLATVRSAGRDYFPKGALCAFCDAPPQRVLEMWAIEFQYRMPNGVLFSQYVYACQEAHAAQFMLTWWEWHPEQGGTHA